MTTKEKLNIRFSRIKEYVECVAFCRCMKRLLAKMEKSITAEVDADKVDDTFVCIKHYYTTLPAVDISQIGDDVYPHISYCHRFNEKVCPIFNCSYQKNNERYHNQRLLLQQAMIDKRIFFKRIFERIK